jgi:hypothetical protein
MEEQSSIGGKREGGGEEIVSKWKNKGEFDLIQSKLNIQ